MNEPHKHRNLDEIDSRPPPAFQEYGGDLLNLERIQLMPLAQRGLFATMRWKVWANDSLPADPDQLARLLGLDPQEVRGNLSDAVMHFFIADPSDKTRLICPELAAQKKRLSERRRKQSIGGHKGGISKREKDKEAVTTLQGSPQAGPLASELKRKEPKRAVSIVGASNNVGDDEVVEMRRAFGEI
jgi:hypothetical protein